MKKKGMVFAWILFGFVILQYGFIPAGTAEAKPIKLTLISAYAKDRLWNKYLFMWMDKVKEKSNGRIEIVWRGGPEVVSPFENLAPVLKGAFDLVSNTPAFHPTVVPEGTGVQLCIASPMEHRRLGSFQIVEQAYRKRVNLTILGWAFHGQGFGTLTVKPVQKLDDFKGLKTRCVPQWVPVAKDLGMSPVMLSIPETYSALEKGIADAILFVLDPTIYENGWYDHLKYIIRPNVFYVTSDFIFMNVDSWNRLSPEDQAILVDSIKALEPELYDFFVNLSEKEVARAVEMGLKKVQFSEADAQEYIRIQFQAMWHEFKKSTPETAAKLEEILPIPKKYLP